MTTKYMHTLDGRPASYHEGEQICFANFYGKSIISLVDSRAQILKNIAATIKWRREKGFRADYTRYGWYRVRI